MSSPVYHLYHSITQLIILLTINSSFVSEMLAKVESSSPSVPTHTPGRNENCSRHRQSSFISIAALGKKYSIKIVMCAHLQALEIQPPVMVSFIMKQHHHEPCHRWCRFSNCRTLLFDINNRRVPSASTHAHSSKVATSILNAPSKWLQK